MSFDTILIANRGEIALRIQRTARAMGYRCVAVFTPGDAGAAHVRMADQAVRVPSYLDAAAIIATARATGAGAVHPGYGFLSENADFARDCAEAAIVFIGPDPDAMALMGEKGAAKAAALAAGVPCLPGYQGADQSDATLLVEGAKFGVPLMVKAAFGGGGKGMRLVQDLDDLPEALERARSEAAKSFGDGTLILERALTGPRHVEMQVFGDRCGHVVHLGERDCSVQRRHQKVVEEAPSPAVTPELRARMGAAAVALAQSCGYVGAGTVEFLLSGDAFWFLEMNTRLQVEHPVTEAITGLDLVEWQIRVARGEDMPLTQDQIELSGHAIEVRLYAEDPAQGFLPQTGRVEAWRADSALRCDHALREGDVVGASYDPMLAKLIAHGPDRDTARRQLIRGLEATVLQGIGNNRAFLASVLAHPMFAEGQADTGFLNRDFAQDPSLTPRPPDPVVLAVAAMVLAGAPRARFGFTNGPPPCLTRRFASGDSVASVTFTLHPDAQAHLTDGTQVQLLARGESDVRFAVDGIARALPCAIRDGVVYLGDHILHDVTLAPPDARQSAGSGQIIAPMAGVVIAVSVAPGDTVTTGQTLAVIEAMKMEHPLTASLTGRVESVAIQPGAQVAARQLLITITPEET